MRGDLVSCTEIICMNSLECLGAGEWANFFQGVVEKVFLCISDTLFFCLVFSHGSSCSFTPIFASSSYSMLCSACNGPCDKVCRSTVIDSVNAAEFLQDCTVIDGNLDINIRRGSECSSVQWTFLLEAHVLYILVWTSLHCYAAAKQTIALYT